MECHTTGGVADEGKIHPRTNREGLAPFYHTTRSPDVSAPGMAPASLLKLFPIANYEVDLTYTIAATLEYSNDVIDASCLVGAMSPNEKRARLAGHPACTSQVFWLYKRVAVSGGVVIQKQRFAIADTCTSDCHTSISFLVN